jgi:YHS domain-containing protein
VFVFEPSVKKVSRMSGEGRKKGGMYNDNHERGEKFMKKIAILLMLTLLLPAGLASAGPSVATADKAQAVDVGNTKCPVMGGPVSGTTFIVCEGKRYGTCCAGCEAEFKKNPDKYLANLKAVTPQKS